MATQTKQIVFGLADLFARTVPVDPTTTAPQIVRVGGLQEVGITLDASEKELITQNVFADDVAITGKKINGKAKYAHIRGSVLSALVFGSGSTSSPGQMDLIVDEVGTALTANAFDVVNAADFIADLGVIYAGTLEPLTRAVDGGTPDDGEYVVDEDAGTYTFSATDTAAQTTGGVLVSYEYKKSTGVTYTLTNSPLGQIPVFSIGFRQNYKGKQATWWLNNAIFKKFDWQGKNVDHTVPDIEFSAYADSADEVLSFASSI
jgi:hypothetical protein